jgi:selenocysteine lyase/cysteine desulfurase
LGVRALATACEELRKVDSDRAAAHERALQRALVGGLGALAGCTVARIWPDSPEPAGIVTFTIDGIPAGLVATFLSAEHGIGVRDGRFCAHPLLARLGLDEGAVRVSFGLSTSSEDIDRLVTAVTALVEHGPTWHYQLTDDGWQAEADARRLPAHLGGGPLGSAGVIPCQP